MKLYRVDWQHADTGTCCEWCGSMKQAYTIARRLNREVDKDDEKGGFGIARGSIEIGLVNVPTDKAGLIAWLNSHLNTDNG